MRITSSLTALPICLAAAMAAAGLSGSGRDFDVARDESASSGTSRCRSRATPPLVPSADFRRPAWCKVPCGAGTAEFVIDATADGWTDLLVSAFAAPSTSTVVRIAVSPAEAAPATPFAWQPLTSETVATFEACHSDAVNEPTIRDGDTVREFYWPVLSARTSRSQSCPVVCGRALCRGERTTAYCDLSAIDADAADLACQVVRLLESGLLSRIETRVGSITDIDADGRLAVVISPRVRQASPTLSAFVRATDFQPDGEPPWSNRADVIYLDPQVPHHELPAVLAHELTHLAQFSQFREQFGESPWPLPDWLLEGHAHAVEVQLTGNWHNLHDRLTTFARRPEACPLVIPDAAAAGLWRDAGCRGAAASFSLWLTRQYGVDWWQRLSALAAPDNDAWTSEFGSPFAELYQAWTLSLAAQDSVAVCTDISVSQPICRHKLGLYSTTQLVLRGTATAYCRLPSSLRPSSLRLKLQIDSGDRPLQLTLLHQP